MANKVVALNEAEIDKLMLEIVDYSNKIKSIFNRMDDLIDKLKNSYQCTSATTLYNKYASFNNNFSIIVNNVLSYNSDLMSLKRKYASSFDDLSNKVKADTALLEASRPGEYKEGR